MGSRIAVIGSINVDLVTYLDRMPERGETVEAPSFQLHHGGKGANQAVAAAKLGAEVLMLGRVGADVFGDDALANLKAHGIDTRHVARAPAVSTGLATILVEPSGENRIMIVAGANGELRPEDVDGATDDLARCELMLLQLEIPLSVVHHAIRFAAAHGIEVILNPAPARVGLDRDALGSVAFLVPNRTELAQLAGAPVATARQVTAAAGALVAAHPGLRTVIATMGAEGALVVTAAASEPIAAPSVEPVDTTGAGDAFIGSFAHFYGAARDAVAAASSAACYAALSTTRRGAQSSFADMAELRVFCERTARRAPF